MQGIKKTIQIMWQQYRLGFVLIMLLGLISQTVLFHYQLKNQQTMMISYHQSYRTVHGNPQDSPLISKAHPITPELFKTLNAYNMEILKEDPSLDPYDDGETTGGKPFLEKNKYNFYHFAQAYIYQADHYALRQSNRGTSPDTENDPYELPPQLSLAMLLTAQNISVFFLMAVIFGILLTSFERLTAFGDFVKMIPAPRYQVVSGKFLLGSVLLTLTYILSLLLNFMIFQQSIFTEIFGMGHWNVLLVNLGIIVSLFAIVFGVGLTVGNIFGHLGSLLIVGMGDFLLYMNFSTTLYQFLAVDTVNAILYKYDHFRNRLPSILQGALSPFFDAKIDLTDRYNTVLITWLIIAAIACTIGLYVNTHEKGTRNGQFILSPWWSTVVKWLAIITTTNLFSYSLFYITEYSLIGRLIRIVFFVIAFYLSRKIYDYLFNVRIGL